MPVKRALLSVQSSAASLLFQGYCPGLFVLLFHSANLRCTPSTLQSFLAFFQLTLLIIPRFSPNYSRLLDFSRLNSIFAALVSSTTFSKIHPPAGTDLAVIVKSSIVALIGTCWVPNKSTAPRLCFNAHLARNFIAAMNRITNIVHLVTILTSSLCWVGARSSVLLEVVPKKNFWVTEAVGV